MDEQQQQQPTELEALQTQCDEYLAGWKRAQADYQNAKRDAEKERQDFAKYANEKFVRELLPAIDQFQIAMAFVPKTDTLPDAERKTWNNWLVGMNAVKSLWDQAAKSIGLDPVPTEGAFDPKLHDAVGEEETTDVKSGHIVRVMQAGWSLNGKVLTPARVIVAK